MGKTLVMKFGGTSMGSAAAIRQSAEIVKNAKADWPHLSVVVSAMSGVTDMLLKGAHAAVESRIADYEMLANQIKQKHLEALVELIKSPTESKQIQKAIEENVSAFLTLCHALQILNELSPRALDSILSLGETMSMLLLAARLREIDCQAKAVHSKKLIRTDAVFQAAHPDLDATKTLCQAQLPSLMQDGIVPIITGFIGSTKDGVTTTLGRGGSDYSAAILGMVLDADEVWIWTDVDGVMTADPRLVPDAYTLATVTYREISELAYFGAKVLHPKTIWPVVEKGITLWVKNTFNPQGPASRIIANHTKISGSIRAVTAIFNHAMITIEGRGMMGVHGIAGRAFTTVASTDNSVSLISQASSEQSICFTLPSNASNEVVAALENEFQAELIRSDINRIWALEDVVIVTAVGAGMRNTPGVAGQIFQALGEASINMIAIAQGSSEVSISLVVNQADADQSILRIHSLIVNEKAKIKKMEVSR